ncbi:serine/threonine-protein kinase [Kitasatospora sp. NPDC101183]|uniref:serine/threonine-protein kinase n=1 Tax=Kitasatospora sp. NPDC101183 TaxID=3364100 RepID=UPI003810D85C
MHGGDLIAGRYELLNRLGRGGMGEVWAAHDHRLQRHVAMKMLALGGDVPTELAHRFNREAVAAAQINHPNVAALYDSGRHDDLLFLVLEKVDGGPLGEHLRTRSALAPVEALTLAQGICTALVSAHAAGVVHYDIKPHNVMLTPDRRVKVVDFGIAGFLHKAFPLARSSQLSPAGTPEYGAPEQFLQGEHGDARSDLYALGGLLFAMLVGRAPFTGPSALAVIRHKLDNDPPRLDAFRPDLPPALVALVAALLARNPAHRPQTAAEVLRRLQGLQAALAIGPVPVVLPPPTVPDAGAPDRSAEGIVRLGWRGDEPLDSYAKLDPAWPFWLVFLALSPVSAVTFSIYARETRASHDISDDLGLGLIASTMLAVLALLFASLYAFHSVLDARARRRRSAWGLQVDSRGITVTSETGSTTFTWPALTRVAIEPIQSSARYDYTGVILDLDPTGPPHALLRPAGWHYVVGFLPMAPRNRVPVCVLGPTTERQRRQLIQALISHAGPTWEPTTFFKTLPTDGA